MAWRAYTAGSYIKFFKLTRGYAPDLARKSIKLAHGGTADPNGRAFRHAPARPKKTIIWHTGIRVSVKSRLWRNGEREESNRAERAKKEVVVVT